MSVILISDSSDEEIQFFPAELSKPKKSCDDDDDVIYCGERRASNKNNNNKGYKIPPSVGKDVTVSTKTVRPNIRSNENNTSDDDVEIVSFKRGIDQNQPSNTVSIRPIRPSADSVNINISRNLTINIEDGTERNKKKVLLTFLGPRNNCTPSEANNLNSNRFKPGSHSTPANSNQANNLNSTRFTPGSHSTPTRSNQANNLNTTRFKPGSHSTPTNPNQTNNTRRNNGVNSETAQQRERTVEPSINNNLILTTIHSSIFEAQKRTAKVSSPGNALVDKPVASNLSKPPVESSKFVAKKKQPPFTARNNAETSTQTVEGKIEKIGKQKVPSTATEPETPKIISQPIVVLNETLQKSTDVNKPSQFKEARSTDPNYTLSTSLKKDKHSPNIKAGNSRERDKSPIAGPSHAIAPSSSSDDSGKDSDEDDDTKKEDCDSSDSSLSSVRTSIPQSELSRLFYKFLDLCTKSNTKTPVLKMKVKLKKNYINSEKSLVNNYDFICALKEVIVRMESKPVRCPLDLMKKVLTALRKDSPSNEKKIRRLEDALNQINKKIKEFEEMEVTSEEEEYDNSYLKLDRYRKKAVQIYNKLCELSLIPADAERPTLRNVYFRGTVPEEFKKSKTIPDLVIRVSRALEKYYNKSHKFPDFHDVKKLMTKLCAEDGVKLRPETLHQLAKTIFEEFGDMLQKRRLYDEYKICQEYLKDDEDDPYYCDPVLASKLDANRKQRKTEKEVLVKYTLKEATLKDKISEEDSEQTSSSENESDENDGSSETKKRKRSSDDDQPVSSNPNKKSTVYKKKEKRQQPRDSSSESEDDKKEKTNKARKKSRSSAESSGSESNEKAKRRKHCSSEDTSENESDQHQRNIKKKPSSNNKDTAKGIKLNEPNKVPKYASEPSTSRSGEYESNSSTKCNKKTESVDNTSEKQSVADVDSEESEQENISSLSAKGNVEYNNVESPSLRIIEDDPLQTEPINNESNEITELQNHLEDESVICYNYEDAPTILISEKVILEGNLASTKVNKKSSEDQTEPELGHQSIESDEEIMILSEGKYGEGDKTSPSVKAVDENSSRTDQNSLTTPTSNSSGIVITNVTTCQQSFSEQIDQNLTIDLLSDDEELERPQTRNSLSQEEVDNLIPLILGQQYR